jgi:hypothetical protein
MAPVAAALTEMLALKWYGTEKKRSRILPLIHGLKQPVYLNHIRKIVILNICILTWLRST